MKPDHLNNSRVLLAVFVFAAIITIIAPHPSYGQRQMTRAMSKVQINSMVGENGVVLNDITLKPGDPAMIIVVNGKNLQTVKSAQLFKSTNVVGQSEVGVKILSASPTQLKLSVRAKTNRFSGSGFYLRLMDGKRTRLVDARNSQFHLGTGKVSAVAAKQQITPTRTATIRTAHTTKQATTPGTKTPATTRATVPRTTTGRTTTPGTKTPVATRTTTPKTTAPVKSAPTIINDGKTPVPAKKSPPRPPLDRTPVKPSPSGAPQITSIEDINGNPLDAAEIPIALGGQPTLLILKGNNLGSVKNAQLFYNQNRVGHKDVQVRILEAEPTRLKVSIQPQKTNIRKTGYHIQLQDAKQNRLTELKVAKFNFRKATAATVPRRALPGNVAQPTPGSSRPTTLPYITTWSGSPGHTGGEIVINGRDIAMTWIEVKLGTQVLEITYKSPESNQVKARLPDYITTADLIIGYGTAETEYVLEADYLVKGDPVITSVSPSRFAEGDEVTVRGTDLDLAFPKGRNNHDYIKISSSSESSIGSDFVRITAYETNEAGTEIKFRLRKAYSDNGYNVQELSPQPTFSGKLRLFGADSGVMGLASPSSVTYEGGPPPLEITKIWNPQWPGEPQFIFLQSDITLNHLSFEGRGLAGCETKMGNVELTESISFHGQDGWLRIPGHANTNPVTFTRDGTSVNTEVITVVPKPAFVPSTNQLMGSTFEIEINKIYTLQGWYLKPSGVSGLTYEFGLSGLTQYWETYLNFELISHTANQIQFRVNRLADLPEGYENNTLFGSTSTTHYILSLKAKYAGAEKKLWEKGYFLVNPTG